MSRLAFLRGESDDALVMMPARAARAAEILVAAVVVALVAALVAQRLVDDGPTQRIEAARHQIETFASALDLYDLDVGHYPTTADGLEALVKSPAGSRRWAGPYLRQTTIPKDPWGEDYVYGAPVDRAPYSLVSRGLEAARTR